MFLGNHLRCACHILNTIAKRTTTIYKYSKVAENVKKDCETVQTALKHLQDLIVKLRGYTSVREMLGTSLHVSCDTRWTSLLDSIDCFLQSKENIINVVKEKKPDLTARVKKIYADYEEIYKDYRTVITPIKNRIMELEVSFSSFSILFKFFRVINMLLFLIIFRFFCHFNVIGTDFMKIQILRPFSKV